jgi:undecaprenyl pyrophosphate phosphatase UppP
MEIPEMWNTGEGKIWFKALVSFIIVCVMATWVYISAITKTFQSFEWTHVMLVLGGLGIVLAGNIKPKDTPNEKTP